MKEYTFKPETVHPDEEAILKYIWQELDETQAIAISEHMADCTDCVRKAQEEARFQFIWERWQAHTHGEMYWQHYAKKILARSYQSVPSQFVKERLLKWLENWQGKLGCMVQIITGGIDQVVEIFTRFPQEIFAPNGRFEFAQTAPVRGTEAAVKIHQLQTKENPQIQVYFDESKRSLLVKIPRGDFDPPLVILAPRIGLPQAIYPEEMAGTNYFTASFTDIPQGGYMLLFEPLQQPDLS